MSSQRLRFWSLSWTGTVTLAGALLAHQQDTQLRQQSFPELVGPQSNVQSVSVLQTARFYFSSLQSPERVPELTAVAADVPSAHPRLRTPSKSKMTLFLGISRVTNHHLHARLQLLHNLLSHGFLFVHCQYIVWKYRKKCVTFS